LILSVFIEVHLRFQKMKSKTNIIFAVSCACLLSGCVRDKENIVFTDEPTGAYKVRTNTVSTLPPPRESNKADELKVRVKVFEYLLSRHFWDEGDYAAIFIKGTGAEVVALQNKFPNHVPPIKPASRAELREGRTPRDMESGKPAIVLSVDDGEPNTDGSVDALGKWFAGDAVSGFYTFNLKKDGADWEIETVK
jgi:hypothetical protein